MELKDTVKTNGFLIAMDDFKGKERRCIKYDEVHIELDNSATRGDVDCTELNNLIESFNIPREPISCTMRIEKKSPNYKRMCKFFKKMFKEAEKDSEACERRPN